MRHGDDVRRFEYDLVGEVRDVAAHLTGAERLGHRLVVHDLCARLVDNPDAAAHSGERIGVEHMVGRLGIGDVEAYVVAAAVYLVDALAAYDLARKLPCRLHGHERIIAVNRHAKLQRDVGDESADRAKPHNTEIFAQKLGSGKHRLAFFNKLRDLIPAAGKSPDPFYRAQHVARRHDEGAYLLLLDRLRVRAGTVENDYAPLGAFFNGNVVVARARARNAQKLRVEFIPMQIGGAYEHAVGVFRVRTHSAPELLQRFQPYRGNGVHRFYLKHGAPQIPSYIQQALQRPLSAWRYRAMRASLRQVYDPSHSQARAPPHPL